jgi:hypothetical protein
MRFGPTTQRSDPFASISIFSSGVSGVGEWMNKLPSVRRITVIRVGNGIFGQGMPKRITGPSTIQTLSTPASAC